MSLITSLKHLNASVKHVAHQIATNTQFDTHKVIHLAFQLINDRTKIEHFKDKAPEIFDLHSMEILTEMGHLINKAQNKLIKSAIPLLEETKQEFFERINQVWASSTGCPVNDPAFGERLFQVKKKDPIVLLALYEHLAKDYAIQHHFGPTQRYVQMTLEAHQSLELCLSPQYADVFLKMVVECVFESTDLNPKNLEAARRFVLLNPHEPILKELMKLFMAKHTGLGSEEIVPLSKEVLEDQKKKMDLGLMHFQEQSFFNITTICTPEDRKNVPLSKNLELAEEVMSYVLRHVRYSSNFFNREDTFINNSRYSKEELEDVFARLKESSKLRVKEMYKNISKIYDLNTQSHFAVSYIQSKVQEYFPIGNCGEMARLGFFYLWKKSLLEFFPFNLVTIENGDHTFLIIDLDSNENPIPLNKISPTAVVCDPWMRKIYPAYLIKDLLQNFTGVDNGLPSLVKFNPEHHKLDILLSNQCLFPSMPEDVKNKLPDLEAILKKMSDSKDLKEKQDLAKKILLMIKPYGLGRNNEDNYLFFTSVVGQLRYFLHGRLSEPNLN